MSSAARTGLTSMTDTQPTQTTNLDRYGYAELPWSRPRDILAAGPLGIDSAASSAPSVPTAAPTPRASAPPGSTATSSS